MFGASDRTCLAAQRVCCRISFLGIDNVATTKWWLWLQLFARKLDLQRVKTASKLGGSEALRVLSALLRESVTSAPQKRSHHPLPPAPYSADHAMAQVLRRGTPTCCL